MKNDKMSKDYITEALFQLMSKERFDEITITDITKKAGVNRVTFYRNFNSKDEIIINYLKKTYEIADKKYKNLNNAALLVLKYFEDNKDIIELLYKTNCKHFLVESNLISANINEDDNISAYFKSFILHGIWGWAEEWFKRGMKESPENVIKIFENIKKS